MTIAEIKAKLGVTSMDISEQKDAAGVVDPLWVSNWNDETRTRVSFPAEVYNKIKADVTFSGLALKGPTVVQPTEVGKLPYTRYIVITPVSIIGTL